jgi:hypothetical protein
MKTFESNTRAEQRCLKFSSSSEGKSFFISVLCKEKKNKYVKKKWPSFTKICCRTFNEFFTHHVALAKKKLFSSQANQKIIFSSIRKYAQ